MKRWTSESSSSSLSWSKVRMTGCWSWSSWLSEERRLKWQGPVTLTRRAHAPPPTTSVWTTVWLTVLNRVVWRMNGCPGIRKALSRSCSSAVLTDETIIKTTIAAEATRKVCCCIANELSWAHRLTAPDWMVTFHLFEPCFYLFLFNTTLTLTDLCFGHRTDLTLDTHTHTRTWQ